MNYNTFQVDFQIVDDLSDATDQLRALDYMNEQVQSQIRDTVQIAQIKGYTWAEIGSALGVSRQAAHKRFSGLNS